MTLISHLPPVYLLTSFYGIRPTTLLASLSIDILATYIPFRLLRPILATHATDAPRGAISNRSIISDLPVQIFTSALGASVYAAVLYSSYLTWLPSHLAVHFDGLRDISAAYAGQFPKLCLTFVPVGIATKVFLFTPSTGAKADLGDIKNTAFNPATATLGETVYQNFWGYSKRTRTLIKRTLTLAAVSYLNTWLQVSVTVEGTESQGAAGWACVWATAAIITGFAYLWVGNIEEVTN